MTLCTLEMPMSWPVAFSIAALAAAALWVGYSLGEAIGFWRGSRASLDVEGGGR